jgi:hypothetical protein
MGNDDVASPMDPSKGSPMENKKTLRLCSGAGLVFRKTLYDRHLKKRTADDTGMRQPTMLTALHIM